jgi:hypothetical protein
MSLFLKVFRNAKDCRQQLARRTSGLPEASSQTPVPVGAGIDADTGMKQKELQNCRQCIDHSVDRGV